MNSRKPERPAMPATIYLVTALAIAAVALSISAVPAGQDPIRVEGTETVSLRAPELASDGSAELTLANSHETRTVVAWKLDYDRDGYRRLSRVHDAPLTVSEVYPEWGPPSAGQRIEPGGELQVSSGAPVYDDLAAGRSVGFVLDVVVFDDHSFEGDADEAARIFARRADELARRERWMPRVREIVRTTHTADAALSELERLAADLRAATGDRQQGAGERDARELRSGRPALEQEVHETIQQLRERPEQAVQILEEYLRWAEAQTEMARRATPAAYRAGGDPSGNVTR